LVRGGFGSTRLASGSHSEVLEGRDISTVEHSHLFVAPEHIYFNPVLPLLHLLPNQKDFLLDLPPGKKT
jgi:hypothetical protein